MNKKKVILIILLLLILDQVVKIWVKTHMTLDQSITIFPNWFFIRFLENPGAAFGMELGVKGGKLILSIFRIALTIGVGYYISTLLRKKASAGLVLGLCLIFAGALGNILDSAFYGLFFSESTFSTVATSFPEGGGSAGFLYGKVVDMLYLPIIQGHFFNWLPWIGGDPFIFFSPIFNIADSYISIGLFYLVLFQRKNLNL